jgi:hypothetical protein
LKSGNPNDDAGSHAIYSITIDGSKQFLRWLADSIEYLRPLFAEGVKGQRTSYAVESGAAQAVVPSGGIALHSRAKSMRTLETRWP